MTALAVARTHASPNRRMWNRFQRNRLGVWSLRIFIVMLVVSAFAEVLSNDKPLVACFQGELFFPILHNEPEVRFGGDFRTPTDWDPIVRAVWVCAIYAVPAGLGAYLVFVRRDVAGG